MDCNSRLRFKQMRMESDGRTKISFTSRKTFVNGDLVYSDNKVDESHRGQELRFKDDCRLQDSRSQRIY